MAQRSEQPTHEVDRIYIVGRGNGTEEQNINARASWSDIGKCSIVAGIITLVWCLFIMWAVGGE